MTVSIDPVTQEILVNAFDSVVEEMSVVEYRSSFSPIIREMLDFNCGLFTKNGELVAASEQIPAQLGLMQFSLQQGLESQGGDLDPGDAMLTNHPYMGGTHTPDLQIFTPVYRDEALIGYAGSIAHHVDVGGWVPGSESAHNTDLFHEGLVFPAIKLLEGGKKNGAVYELITANVRDPVATVGDLDAQLAACRRGGERLIDLCDRYGEDDVTRSMANHLEVTNERTIAAFEEWAISGVEAEGFLDDSGPEGSDPVAIRVSLRTVDGTLEVDFTGTSDQAFSGMNVPIASTHAGVYFAVRCFLDDIPYNAGLTSAIRLKTREGSFVHPRFPAAVSARHLAVQRIADTMVAALSEAFPERSVAGSHVSFPAFVFEAFDNRVGRPTILTDILGGGGGARRDAPGDDGIDTYTSNCAILPAEVAELEYPWRVLRTELVDGSGGDGLQQGGLGLRRDYELLADYAKGMYYIDQTDPRFAARGRNGGGPGAAASVSVTRSGAAPTPLPGKAVLELGRGDVLSFTGAGGGGFGSSNNGGDR